MIQSTRHQAALQDVHQRRALQERHWRPLHEPRAQPEEVVHGIGMIPQPVLLLEQLESRLYESLQHVEETLDAVGVGSVLVHEDATDVEEARVLVGRVNSDDLTHQTLEDLADLLADATKHEAQTAATPLHDAQVALVLVEGAGNHRPHFENDGFAWVDLT